MPFTMPQHAAQTILDALEEMRRANYRPGLPSDGFGNIIGPVPQRVTLTELECYANAWWDEEDAGNYFVGCPSSGDRVALILTVEAARLICGGDTTTADRLLEAARRLIPKTSETSETSGLRAMRETPGSLSAMP